MADDYRRIELITGEARRRRWTTEQKLQIIEESFLPGETVSSVARRCGVAPNLLYRWRRLLTEGGAAAVGSDEPVVGSSEVRRLEERVRDLERLLGRKTMEVEILKEALARSELKKTELAALVAAEGRFPMKAVAETIGVARSHLHDKVHRAPKPRGPYRKPEDDTLVQLVRRLVDERPTYGYRRITALANRERARAGEPAVNHKRVFRIMRQNGMLLRQATGGRTGRVHDGKVIVTRLEPALVLRRLRFRKLEGRPHPDRLHARCPRPRGHRMACRRRIGHQRGSENREAGHLRTLKWGNPCCLLKFPVFWPITRN